MKPILYFFIFLITTLVSHSSFSQEQALLAGSSFSKKLLKNEKHIYTISLEKGSYAELVVMQKGVDLIIDVTDPSGKKIGSFDSPNGSDGPEPVSVTASMKGEYKLYVYPLIDEPNLSDSEKVKWAEQNQGAYEINNVVVLSAKAYQQKLDKEKAENALIVSWLSENAHSLTTIAPNNSFEDLQWLKPVLNDVRFVGVGTQTAGTHEFFQVRHRLFEFLVKEMGFTVFAMPISYAAAVKVNDYVMKGGDMRSLAPYFGTLLNVEEVKDMIEWMRSYNQTQPMDKKIKFLGFDIGNFTQTANAKQVQNYLEKVDPVLAKAKTGLLKFILEGEEFNEKLVDSCKKECNNLLLRMQMSKGNYIQLSSQKEYEDAIQYVILIAQFFDANFMADNDPLKPKRDWTSYYYMSNLNWLIQHENPNAKFLIFAHNIYITKDPANEDSTSVPIFGGYLKKFYGNAYYAIGLYSSKMSFGALEFIPQKNFDQLPRTQIEMENAKQNWLEWYLAQTKKEKFIINFRNSVHPDNVNVFLNRQLFSRAFFAIIDKTQVENSYIPVSVGKSYDGLIFIDNSTPTRPLKD